MFSSRSLLFACLAFLAALCALAVPVDYQNLRDEQSVSHVERAGGGGGNAPGLTTERCISLVREHIGTGHEHWALFISTQPTGSGTHSRPYAADGYLIEAVWDGATAAPLSVASRGPFHRTYPYQVGQDLKTMVPLGCVADVGQMQALLNHIWVQSAPTRPPRQENCTVFVRNALHEMAQHNHGVRYDIFEPIFNAHYTTVKANTDPFFNYPR